MKKALMTAVCIWLSTLYIFAQPQSTLYRGRLPEMFTFLYNGTYFWSGKEFVKGDIYFNGKLYTDVLLNIDAYKQEVQVQADPKATPLIVYRDEVAWVTRGTQTFVNLRYLGYTDAPTGFFELIRDGEQPLFIQVIKRHQISAYNENGTGIGYDDPDYNRDVHAYFAYNEAYYTIKDGKVLKIRRRQFKRSMRTPTPITESILAQASWHPVVEPGGKLFPELIPQSLEDLPAGFFAPAPASEEEEFVSGAQMASYRNKIYVIGVVTGQSDGVVSGSVTDMETAEALSDVVVYDEKTQTYARTDKRGRYSLRLPTGSNTLHYMLESKEESVLKVDIQGSGILDVALSEKITLLEGAVISAQSMEQHRKTGMGIEKVSIQVVNKIPTAFGEGDVLKAIHTLPGVQSSGEAAGGINVRGGSPGENLILFNENTIFNPSHLFGIFSSFNPDLVESVELYKGTVPAEFGGRISSVMDVRAREGDPDRFHGSLGIGVLTSRFHVEGPLWKGKTSVILGARTTYSDWILKELPSTSNYSGASAGFTDANFGITHRFNADNSLQLSTYYASDRFALSDDMEVKYRNLNGSLIFLHKGREGRSFQLSGGYDYYSNTNGDYSWTAGAYDLTTTIGQGFAKALWRLPLGNHRLTAGTQAVLYSMNPGQMDPHGEASELIAAKLDKETGIEPAVFVSDTWSLTETVSVEGGARVSAFLYPGMEKPYLGPELRFSAKYTPVGTFSVKGGFDMMRQYIHLISNTSGISPTDTWRLSGNDIRPTTGWQSAFGLYWSLPGAGLDFSAESYWKESSHALDYKAGAKLAMNPALAADLIDVRTRAYGLELMVKKPAGKLTGWMSYTWSRSRYQEMEDRGFETIAGGDWYNAPFDKPHEFKVVANWAMTHRFSLSTNVEYSTGRPMTAPIGQYFYGGSWRVAYGDRNSYRIPDYFRVDVALNIDPGHYLKALAHSSVTIGIYNILGRKNPYSVYFQAPQWGRVNGYLVSVFANPVPYVNLNILF